MLQYSVVWRRVCYRSLHFSEARREICSYSFFFYFRNEENDEDATTAALTLTHESLFPSEGELAQLCTSLNSVTHIIISLMELLVRKRNILP